MFLAVGLILGYMPLSILLYFKLVKTNRSRVFYAFVISLVFLFTKKVFISLTDKGTKTPDNVKIIFNIKHTHHRFHPFPINNYCVIHH